MTNRITSITRRAAVVASAALLGASCSDSTAPNDPPGDAALAAQTFSQLADSVGRAGGDADVASAYAGIAGIVRTSGRVTPITLTIDGTARAFVASAVTVETTVNN